MAGRVEARLAELGLDLPPPFAPAATYEAYVIVGGLVFVSGQGPVWGTEIRHTGKVGRDLDLAAGREAARLTVLNLVVHLRTACEGDLDRVRRCVKLFGLVNCGPDFADAETVVDGACGLLADLFGEAGRPALSVTAAPGLPVGIAVELDAVFEIA